jgi:hypothetical protein
MDNGKAMNCGGPDARLAHHPLTGVEPAQRPDRKTAPIEVASSFPNASRQSTRRME